VGGDDLVTMGVDHHLGVSFDAADGKDQSGQLRSPFPCV
jgi:hypothetical protein